MTNKEELLDYIDWCIDDNVSLIITTSTGYTSDKTVRRVIPKHLLEQFKNEVRNEYDDELYKKVNGVVKHRIVYWRYAD